MKYILEIKMEKTNGFSKKLDWKIEVEKDNENQKLIKKECICQDCKKWT